MRMTRSAATNPAGGANPPGKDSAMKSVDSLPSRNRSLAAVAASERFREGRLSTDFIAESFPGGFAPPAGFVAADRVILIAAALAETRLRSEERRVGKEESYRRSWGT